MNPEFNYQQRDKTPNLDKQNEVDTGVTYESARSSEIIEGGPGHPDWYRDTISTPRTASQTASTRELPSLTTVIKGKAKKLIDKFLNRKSLEKQSANVEVTKKAIEPKVKSEVKEYVDSIGEMLTEAKDEAKKELETTKDGTTKAILGYMERLEKELGKEKLDWKQIEFFVRQIAILLSQKMAANENKQIEQLHEMMRNDITKVIESYKGKWELMLGIASGSLQIVGGGLGIGGGFAGIGGVAKGTLKTIQGISQGFGTAGQGVQPFSGIARNANERNRTLQNFELERDRGYKGSAESSLQNDRSARGAQLNQTNSFIDAAFKAFVSVAQ